MFRPAASRYRLALAAATPLPQPSPKASPGRPQRPHQRSQAPPSRSSPAAARRAPADTATTMGRLRPCRLPRPRCRPRPAADPRPLVPSLTGARRRSTNRKATLGAGSGLGLRPMPTATPMGTPHYDLGTKTAPGRTTHTDQTARSVSRRFCSGTYRVTIALRIDTAYHRHRFQGRRLATTATPGYGVGLVVPPEDVLCAQCTACSAETRRCPSRKRPDERMALSAVTAAAALCRRARPDGGSAARPGDGLARVPFRTQIDGGSSST